MDGQWFQWRASRTPEGGSIRVEFAAPRSPPSPGSCSGSGGRQQPRRRTWQPLTCRGHPMRGSELKLTRLQVSLHKRQRVPVFLHLRSELHTGGLCHTTARAHYWSPAMDASNTTDNSPIPSYSPSSILGKRPRDEPDTQSSAAKPTPTKLFRCGDCDKSYSRVDHLARHVRLHTQVCSQFMLTGACRSMQIGTPVFVRRLWEEFC